MPQVLYFQHISDANGNTLIGLGMFVHLSTYDYTVTGYERKTDDGIAELGF